MVFLAARRSVPGWVRDPLWAKARQVPAFDIDFTRGSIVDRIGGIAPTFTRAGSVKLAWNGSQFISYAADVPAFQRAADGVMEYLHEPASTNLCSSSTNLNAGWSNVSAPITADALIAPDGTLTGHVISSTSATNDRRGFPTSFSSSGNKAVSIFIRKGSSERTSFNITELVGGVIRGAGIVTWISGVPQLALASGATSPLVTGPYNNGWWRVGFIAVGVVHTSTPQLRIFPNSGDATALDVGIWGVQLEDDPIITSLILTDGSTVLRAADVMSITGADATTLTTALDSAFWAYAEGTPLGGTGVITFVSGDDGTNSERWRVGHNGSSSGQSIAVDDGAVKTNNLGSGGSWPLESQRKIVGSFATDNCRMMVTGQPLMSDTSATLPTVNQFKIGAAQAISTVPSLTIRRIALFTGIPSDATLANVVA